MKRVSSQNAYTDQHYFGPDARRSRMLLRMNNPRSPLSPVIDSADPLPSGYGTGSSIPGPHATSSSGPFVNSLPGREFMGTMETVLQSAIEPLNAGGQPANDGESATLNSIQADASSSSSPSSTTESQILTPQALLDHMEFLIKVRRLQITVGSAKWSFKDLCHRATLPFGSEVHPIQAYLDMIIPCLIITPLDCFWEGAKVLGPEEATWVPWWVSCVLPVAYIILSGSRLHEKHRWLVAGTFRQVNRLFFCQTKISGSVLIFVIASVD